MQGRTAEPKVLAVRSQVVGSISWGFFLWMSYHTSVLILGGPTLRPDPRRRVRTFSGRVLEESKSQRRVWSSRESAPGLFVVISFSLHVGRELVGFWRPRDVKPDHTCTVLITRFSWQNLLKRLGSGLQLQSWPCYS